MRKKAKRISVHQSKLKPGDKTLLTLLTILILFGIVMIYNATPVSAQGAFGEAYRFLIHHISWVILGLVGFLFFYNFDYKNIGVIAYPLFLFTLIVLFLLGGIGLINQISNGCRIDITFAPCINGANRWLYLNPPPLPGLPVLGVLGFQPSELAKLALILYLAVQIPKNLREGKYNPFFVFIIATGLISFLVFLQPNLSTAALIFLVGVSIYFASEATLVPLIFTFPLVVTLGSLFIMSSDYRKARLLTFLAMRSESSESLTTGYHIKQILIALGSGGIFGVGFGQSRQKYQYVPEVSADSIFAIIGEELGFIGATALIILFTFLIYKGYSIAKKAPDLLGRLLAVGITTWLAVQFFVNIAAMTGLIPLTGIPLPLISYGGSSTIFSLMGLGILANISRHT